MSYMGAVISMFLKRRREEEERLAALRREVAELATRVGYDPQVLWERLVHRSQTTPMSMEQVISEAEGRAAAGRPMVWEETP